MPIAQSVISKAIEDFFPESEFEIIDQLGDQDHYKLIIKSDKFIGLGTLAQHKLVYKALGPCVGNELHALSIETKV